MERKIKSTLTPTKYDSQWNSQTARLLILLILLDSPGFGKCFLV